MQEPQNKTWEQETLEKVALFAVREQRTARRWKIFFRLIGLFIISLIVAAMFGWLPSKVDKSDKKLSGSSYAALVRMVGEIASDGVDGSVTVDKVVEALHDAFEDKQVKGVILQVNSPGGSPVASHRIYNEISALRKKYPQKPIYTVVDDICASGCYYVASASDKIFVDQASIVGSIGVLMNGFGFVGSLEKLGVERRLLTSGSHKGILDPFSPLVEQDKMFVEGILNEIHQQFIQAVRNGRGNRLKETPEMFSGLFWSGNTAINMGLVDAQGTVASVAQSQLGTDDVVEFTHKRTLAELFADQMSSAATASIKSLFATKMQ